MPKPGTAWMWRRVFPLKGVRLERDTGGHARGRGRLAAVELRNFAGPARLQLAAKPTAKPTPPGHAERGLAITSSCDTGPLGLRRGRAAPPPPPAGDLTTIRRLFTPHRGVRHARGATAGARGLGKPPDWRTLCFRLHAVPRPGTYFGSEGRGFESLRARHAKPPRHGRQASENSLIDTRG